MDWDWSLDGWTVAVGILSACSCALLGNYLVLRRMSLMGDAISHAVLPGLAVAFLISGTRASLPMFLGAVVVGVLTALLTEVIRRHGKVEHGAAMGVVFSIFFALGILLIRRAADHVDLDPGCVLYGNLAHIPLTALDRSIPPAAITLAAVLLCNALFVGLFFKELKISAFDPALATTLGINASVMHYLLMVFVAVTTVANFEAVGSILVIAMLIVPAATAHLLTDRLGVMIAISLLVAVISAVSGHFLAVWGPEWVGFNGDAYTAPMMTVVAGLMLLLAVLFSPAYGVVSRAYRAWALSMQIIREDILGLLYRRSERQPAEHVYLQREALLAAFSNRRFCTAALRALERRGHIEHHAGKGFGLTSSGRRRAVELVRSHRLWETFLDEHFQLPPDHLHSPAERVEHYITPAMNEELRRQLTDPSHDPQGKEIPR